MMRDAEVAMAQEPAWSPWRDTALTCRGGSAPARRRRRPAQRAVRRSLGRSGPKLGNTDTIVNAEAELALLAMDRGTVGRGRRQTSRAPSPSSTSTGMHDYATSVLAFAAAARLALHDGDLDEMDRQLTRAMRARPVLHLCLPLRCGTQPAPSGQGLPGARRPRDGPAPAPRDRRRPPSTGPTWASWSTDVRDFRELLTSGTGDGSNRGSSRSLPPSCGCCRTCRPT